MKIKILILVFMSCVSLVACKDVKDKATESVVNSVVEETLKQAGVATKNIERANKNKASVEIDFDGEQIFYTNEDFETIINAAGKKMVVFSVNSENAKINITFSGLENMLETKPLKGINKNGKSEPKDANGTVVSITMAKENDFAYMLFDGEATVTKFSQDEVEIEFSGKAGNFIDANTSENWKPIQGKITSKFPATSLIQVKAEELYY